MEKEMRDKFIRFILTIAIAVMAVAFSGLTCYAVPAMPGNECGEDALCPSVTSDTLVTLDILKERDRLKEEKAGKAAGSAAGEQVAGKVKTEAESTIPLLCIVIGFNGTTADAPGGLPYSDDYNWGEYIFKSEKSLTQYYMDMSLGKFTFVPAVDASRYGYGGNTNKYDTVNDGIIHVTVDQPHLDWSVASKIDNTEMYAVFKEAVQKAAVYADVAGYDVDEDGVISNFELAVCFILAGYDTSTEPLEQSRGVSNYIWPHAYSFEAMDGNVEGFTYPAIDGVKLYNYICMAENMVFNDEPEQERLSTLFHELGHYLGLPDLYNTVDVADGEWQYYAVGVMSLMDQGCWGRTADGSPTSYSLDVWSRYALGWLDAEKITKSGTYTVSGDDYSEKTENPRLYYIAGLNEGEYYLVENHRFTGWDEDQATGMELQLGVDSYNSNGGIVIWHIDQNIIKAYKKQNRVNAVNHRPGVMPIYPEQSSESKFKIISDMVRGRVYPDAFYVAKYYARDGLTLTLPGYGRGKNADARMGRSDTCTTISFPGKDGKDMQIKVDIKTNQWLLLDGKWYYLGNEGQIVTGWIKTGGKWYYLNEADGAMLTGWLMNGGKWYYLTGSGAMKTGWLKIKGAWYYFTPSGAMKTGWLKSGGEWYYLTGSGAMKTGWLKYGNSWHYLSSTGAMVTGSCTINGIKYNFSSSGVCLNP